MNNTLIEKILEKYLLWETTNEKPSSNPFIGKYVIVRGYDAGVRAGKLIDATLWNIILEDARMLRRRWCKEGIGLSWIARRWLNEDKPIKILEPQKKILITDSRASTFFECTSDVETQIRNILPAEQS